MPRQTTPSTSQAWPAPGSARTAVATAGSLMLLRVDRPCAHAGRPLADQGNGERTIPERSAGREREGTARLLPRALQLEEAGLAREPDHVVPQLARGLALGY